MTLDQIKTLCCIVESGTLKKASDKLHKTQPALSMSLKKLEDEFGIQLLTRDNYRLTLTEAGKPFYKKAKELLQSANQLSALGKHLEKGNEAKIRIGYDVICPIQDILAILKQCQVDYPYTEIELIGGIRFTSLELLKNEEIDLAITPWWTPLYALGDLASLPITTFSVILVSTPELFPEHQNVTVNDLKQQVHISVEQSELAFDTMDLIILEGCREWRTKDAYTLKNMLIEGLGWGFIPEFLVAEQLESGELVRLKPPEFESTISGEIRLIKRKNSTLGPVSSMIWDSFL